jgi:hypothetical protein
MPVIWEQILHGIGYQVQITLVSVWHQTNLRNQEPLSTDRPRPQLGLWEIWYGPFSVTDQLHPHWR